MRTEMIQIAASYLVVSGSHPDSSQRAGKRPIDLFRRPNRRARKIKFRPSPPPGRCINALDVARYPEREEVRGMTSRGAVSR